MFQYQGIDQTFGDKKEFDKGFKEDVNRKH